MKKITKIESVTTHRKKKLRVAAYCRVSTASDEQLVSLETQKAHYEEYIASNPEWEFAGLYYDEGLSGTKKEKRPVLIQMITDCENGKIDFIVIKSLSRFARNTTDCLELVRRLLKLHISIYFEKENLNLRNERYVGDCLYQKTYTDFRLRHHINRGEVDQFYEENHHDAIVSREVFDAVRKVINQEHKEKNRSEGNLKYQNRYAFSGKLLCGECGSVFKRRNNITGKLKYPAWVCSVHHKDRTRCSMKYVRESVLETAFTTVMNKLIFGRKEVLQTLLDNLTTQSHKSRLRRIDEVERTLEKMQNANETSPPL